MSGRILITMAFSAVLAMVAAVWTYRSGAGAVAAVLVYSFGGSVLTVLIAAIQLALEPVLVGSGGGSARAGSVPDAGAAPDLPRMPVPQGASEPIASAPEHA